MKKALFLILCIALVCCACTLAFAETGLSNGFEYEYDPDGKTCRITGWSGSATVITIPSSFGKYILEGISGDVFRGCGITKAILPDDLDWLDNAFDDDTVLQCFANSKTATNTEEFVSPTEPDYVLHVSNKAITIRGYTGDDTKVSIPGTIDGVAVKTIGVSAFEDNRNITSVTVPSGVTAIEYAAFYDCSSLTNVDLPDDLRIIENNAFKGTDLKRVILPDGLESMWDSDVFKDETIRQCHADSKAAQLVYRFVSPSASDYIIYSRDKAVSILEYIGADAEVSIPGTIDGIDVKTISEGAFRYNATVTTVIVPSEVNRIEYEAFYNCKNLTNVELPGSLKHIGERAFNETSLKKVTLPDNLDCAWDYNEFNEETVLQCHANGKTAQIIGNFVSPSEPDFVLYTRDSEITIAGYVGENAAVTIPAAIDDVPVKIIGDGAFKNNKKITSVAVPSGVTAVNSEAFYDCKNLTAVDLPDSLKTIGERAFNGTGLKKVILPENLDCWWAYNEFNDDTILLCHADSKTAQIIGDFISPSEPGFVLYTRDKEIIIVEYVGETATVTIPATIDGVVVKTIGTEAFKNNTTLTSVTISSGLTVINSRAFYDCMNLTAVDLPDTLKEICDSAFRGTGLKTITLPDDLTSLWTYSWYNTFDEGTLPQCHANSKAAQLVDSFVSESAPDFVLYSRDKEIVILEYIGKNAEVTIPAAIDGIAVKKIGSRAFFDDATLTSVTVPSGVTVIDSEAFYDCRNLATANLPDTLKEIGSKAFNGTGLKKIILPDDLTSVWYGYGVRDSFDEGTVLQSHANSNTAQLIDRFVSLDAPDFTLYTRNKSVSILDYTGSDTEITIPAAVDGVAVKEIVSGVFDDYRNLKTATIPTSVTKIGDNAFPKKNETLAFDCDSFAFTWAKENGYSDADDNPQAEYKYKLNHVDVETDPVVHPLPTKTGLTEGSHCNKCKKVLVAQKETPKLTLDSATLAVEKATDEQEVKISATTSTTVTQINMYVGSTLAKSWTEGYSDEKDVRTWNMTYAFSGTGSKDITFKATGLSNTETEGNKASITITAKPTISSAKFAKAKATVKQNVTLTVATSTTVDKLSMFSGNTLIKSWTSGYTDSGTTRTWKMTYAFSGKGSKTMTFKGTDANGVISEAKTAKIQITAAPTLTSVKFVKTKATVKQETTITAVTSTNTTKLAMYNGSKAVKSWTTGYTDSGTTRTWTVSYAFAASGKKTMSFKAIDANGYATAAKKATITITAAPKITSVKFAKTKATVKQNVTITAVTSKNTTKLNLYSGDTLLKAWTEGYTDSDSARTWKVTYAFAKAGTKEVSFRPVDENDFIAVEKTAKITITAAPTLTSVAFGKTKATVKQNTTITAVTSTNTTKLAMYNGSKAVKSWTTGYTDSGTTRTWNVSYSFTGSGKKTMSFKAIDANGYATAAKKATITITAAPTLTSVSFAKTKESIQKNVTITAVTSTNTTKLNMYSNSKLLKSWTKGYSDDGTKRTWKVSYAFTGAGKKTMSFKAEDANGYETAAKSATITITSSVPTLSSVEFGSESAAVKKSVRIIAVTSKTATKLIMYNGTKAVKSWTTGYTDSGSIRTWKVSYTFTGTGKKTMTFKVSNEAGESAAKKAIIEITK